ncbi:hypothetical protein HY621_03940 [Candidatus Uhrbacteria bacterium]|nr:hypothetical protein [Candidatus Uhrbacteria bacterium]
MKSSSKKTLFTFLIIMLFAPVLFFSTAKPAHAVVPTATTVDIPKTLLEYVPNIIWFGLENAGYRGLKFLSHKLSENSANALFGEWATGEKGKLPAFDPLTWTFYAIDAAQNAVGGALEGMVLGFDVKYEKDRAGLHKDLGELEDLTGSYSDNEQSKKKFIEEQEGELKADIEEFCGDSHFNADECDTAKLQLKGLDASKADLKRLTQIAGDFAEKRKNVQTQVDTYDAAEFSRMQKFQKNAAGALSSAAYSFLQGVCAPKLGVMFRIGLGLSSSISEPEKPICEYQTLKQNWSTFIQDTGAAISNTVTGKNGWQLLADALDPYKSDVGITFGLQSSIMQDQIDELQAKEKERWENMIAGSGLKPVTDWAGNILSPGGIRKAVSDNVLGEISKKDPLTGKLLVDTVDIIADFVETFVGKSVELGFKGVRRLVADANRVGVASAGGDFTSSSVQSAQLYNPAAAPSYGGSQSPTVQRIAQLVKVKTSGGQIQNVLSELQIQDCFIHPNACTIGSAFAEAIRNRMTVAEAMEEYKTSGGSSGLNPEGRFGFKHTSAGRPSEEPRDYQNDYPYRSMVILRKYRVLPVAWELAALYIRDNPGPCGQKDCTLQDLVNNFNNKDSVFFRLIDPSWVLKLPPVRCELKGYGPTALESTQDPSADPKERDPDPACITDTNGDGVSTCPPDLQIRPSPRPEACVDETSCLSDSADGKCEEKSIGFGYCIEEWKKFGLQGTVCPNQFASCDAFTEITPYGKGENFALLKDTIGKEVYGSEDEKKNNFCKEENAGCTWLSQEKRQYETCVIDFQRDKEGNPIKDGKRVLMENKLGTVLDNNLHNVKAAPTADLAFKDARSATLALCQKVIDNTNKEKTKVVSSPWVDTPANRVYLTHNAPRCEESADGCRTMSNGANLKVAPAYLKCDETGAFERSECKRYALHCKEENVGCQLYSALDSEDPDIPALSPQACLAESCVGIRAYFLQPSFFDKTSANSLAFFKEDRVNRCNAQEAGCEEFTNIDLETKGGEAHAYFTKTSACEFVSKDTPENRTVFYSYYGSEQGGRQPVAFYLKADASGDPACAVGSACTCDAKIFSDQFNTPTQPLTCREFISAAGAVSYRYIDKLVYQTDDCSEYRRAADNAAGRFISRSLSAQCSASAVGCRAYSSTTAGNYSVIIRDTFEKEPFRSGWGPDTSVDTSREAETVGGRSLRITSSAGSLEAEKQIVLSSLKSYTLTLNAKAVGTSTLAIIGKDTAGITPTNTLASATFTTSGWQYFNFTIENATTTSVAIRITPPTGTTLSQAFLDTIFIKESDGATIYAIDTSTKTESARPEACEMNGSGTYQTSCRLYSTPEIETPLAFSGFTNVCPLPFVGCREFKEWRWSFFPNETLDSQPTNILRCSTDKNTSTADARQALPDETLTDQGKCFDEYISTVSGKRFGVYVSYESPKYLVDKPNVQCRSEEANCTAYGAPVKTREHRKADTSGTVTTVTVSNGVASSTTANDGYKEEWQTVFYKITPDQITQNLAKLSDVAPTVISEGYKAGVCKQEEQGCKAYNTESAKRYFKTPGKNLCYWTKGNVFKGEGATEPKEGWFYKACRKKSGDLLDDEKNQENELYYPSYACQSDDDCSGLESAVYTGRCDALISCDSVDSTTGKGGGPAAYSHAFETYNTTQSKLEISAPTITYWNDQGPAKYFKQCPSNAVGCRKYKDPECIECGDGNPHCPVQDPGNGTLRSDYGRLDPTKGVSGASCKVYRTYLGDVRDTQKECSGELNIENGCILLQDTDPDAEAKIYNSSAYYNDYFKTKRGITLNIADSRNAPATANDANILLKGKLDRECKVSLDCANDIRVQGDPNRKICTERIPCLKRNANGGCIVPALPALGTCKGEHISSRCSENRDCQCTGTRCVGECIPLGVCKNNAERCTRFTPCSSGVECITNPTSDDLITYCSSLVKGLCESDVECYWNKDLAAGHNCQPSPTASLAGNFKAPYLQIRNADGSIRLTPDKYHELDLSFAGLSGYARPNMVFKDDYTTKNPSGRDSYFLPWIQSFTGANAPLASDSLGPTIKDPDERLQNKINISGVTEVASSCRLYPRSDSPKVRVDSKNKNVWNDACNYISGTAEKFVGVYGYCLEPYPQWQTRYGKERTGKVCAKNMNRIIGGSVLGNCEAGNIPDDCGSDGPCVYRSYSQACLLWNPITLSNQTASSAAAANLGAPASSYASGGITGISFCVEQSNPTEIASSSAVEEDPTGNFGMADPDSTPATYTRDHWLYEKSLPLSDCPVGSASIKCYQTRDSSNLNKSDGYLDRDRLKNNPDITSAGSRLLVMTEFNSNFWNNVGNAAGASCLVGTTVGSVSTVWVGGVGAIPGGGAGCAVFGIAGGLASFIGQLLGWGGDQIDDTAARTGYTGSEVNLPSLGVNSREVVSDGIPNGTSYGFAMDSIYMIEYILEGATRTEFKQLIDSGMSEDGVDNPRGYSDETYLVQSGVSNRIYAGKRWDDSTPEPRNDVGFYFDEKAGGWGGHDRKCIYNNNQGGRALCWQVATENLGAWTNSQGQKKSYWNESCNEEKNFVVIGPVIANVNGIERLAGWKWLYCDASGGGDQAVAVSTKIYFKKNTTTVHHQAQNRFINYCTAFVKPITTNGQNVGLYEQTKNPVASDSNADNQGRHGTYLTLGGKSFLTSVNPAQRVVLKAQRALWDRDEFYTEFNTATQKNYLWSYNETKTYTTGKEKLIPGTENPGFNVKSFSKPHTDKDTDISVYPSLTREPIDTLRTSVFAKAYEYWKWKCYTPPCTAIIFGVCISGGPDECKYEKTASWDGTKFVGSDAGKLQTMWDTSRTEAQGRAPVTSPAIPMPAGDKYTKGDTGGFHFDHDFLLYPKVRISFWVDVPNNDQLPLRKIIVDWGDGRRYEYTNSNKEGSGKNERPGPAVNGTTTNSDDLPFEFSHIYGDGKPNGKHICIYTMDNWEAKAATCGTVYKDSDDKWGITPSSWQYKYDLATFPLREDASKDWPEADARTKYNLYEAQTASISN